MTGTHHATLIFLLKHLERVTEFKDLNRMASANLAIVFGPTLMWPPSHLTTTNMALNMMQQNMVVEALITAAVPVFAARASRAPSPPPPPPAYADSAARVVRRPPNALLIQRPRTRSSAGDGPLLEPLISDTRCFF